jgi:hypothetical protein
MSSKREIPDIFNAQEFRADSMSVKPVYNGEQLIDLDAMDAQAESNRRRITETGEQPYYDMLLPRAPQK